MKQIFTIAPPNPEGGANWLVVAVVVISCAIALAAIWYVAGAAKRVRFEVGEGSLKIAGDWYGRTIPIDELQLDRARALNLDEDTDYRLRWRTNGTGMPNYKAGWFKLANGEKALVFITDRTHVVYVPTSENYSVMLSVANPKEFIGALSAAQRSP